MRTNDGTFIEQSPAYSATLPVIAVVFAPSTSTRVTGIVMFPVSLAYAPTGAAKTAAAAAATTTAARLALLNMMMLPPSWGLPGRAFQGEPRLESDSRIRASSGSVQARFTLRRRGPAWARRRCENGTNTGRRRGFAGT